MAQKQNKKTSGAPAPHVHTKHLRYSRYAGLILLVVLLIFIGFKTYTHRQDVNKTAAIQKTEFNKVDAQMRSVMTQIEATAGQPYELHYGHGCGYTAAKFERGQLNCSIYYVATYGVSSVASGNSLAQTVLPLTFSQSLHGTSTIPADLNDIKYDGAAAYYDAMYSLGCNVNYDIKPKDNYNSTLYGDNLKPIGASYAANFSFTCGKGVVKALYPIVKSP
jgi:hypothetical protein